MTEQARHIPVLLDEVIEHLAPQRHEQFIDGTVGQGGHAAAILEASLPGARLLGIDRDPRNLAVAKERLATFRDRVVLVQDSYLHVKKHANAHAFTDVGGILLDLGFSSAHIDEAQRGFSFQRKGPLDMRYDPSQALTATKIVNTWNEEELAKIFRQYGEERYARQMAQAIIARRGERPFKTTTDLADVIAEAVPRRGRIHPATRVFQALRIAVNDELRHLTRALPDMVNLLKTGGRLAVISFHSGEDRIVKKFIKQKQKENVLTPVNKDVIQASADEIEENPRARSAKLRVAEKL